MVILLTKILLMLTLGVTLYQDIKYRQVYWFLFPLIGLCAGTLFFSKTLPELFYIAILINSVFVFMLLGMALFYTKVKLKTAFGKVIGLGDVLLFFALIFSCASISFIVLLPSALIFSLVLHLILSKKSKDVSVPLAGYMSLFFGLTYIGFWTGLINSIYQI